MKQVNSVAYFWMTYLRFLAAVFISTGVLQFYRPQWLIQGIWAFILFFTVLIPMVYFLAMSGVKRKDGSSVLIILAANVIKMIISLVLCAYYIIKFSPKPVIFASNFFLLYIAFAVFEIHCLLHNLRLANQENNSSNK